MKNNIFMYIFIIFVICIVVFAAVYIYKQNNKKVSYEEVKVYTEETQVIPNIRLAIAGIDTINPILSKNQNVQDISKLIYEPLFSITHDYKLEITLNIENVGDNTFEDFIWYSLQEGFDEGALLFDKQPTPSININKGESKTLNVTIPNLKSNTSYQNVCLNMWKRQI